MSRMNIAVIGSGISGLSAAWLLSKRHLVTVYESGARPGGHANTLDVETSDGPIAVDTGFIVYNERNYPNLTALYDHLNVETDETEMSFALSSNAGGYEYAGSGAAGFFGQKRNVFSIRHWRLLREISRFFSTAGAQIETYPSDISLEEFLRSEAYSDAFVLEHIIPMGAAIWSTTMEDMRGFPAKGFIDFYANHGMLQFNDRPLWRTVNGGSRNYVHRLIEDGDFTVRCGSRISQISRRADAIHISGPTGSVETFDHVVIATHGDQALQLLGDPDPMEKNLLGAFTYQINRAVLHRDARWMPKRRGLWSSWNYLKQGHGAEQELCLTYWMNRLQKLDTTTDMFVTLNPTSEIVPNRVDATIDYEHPVFSAEAIEAQQSLWSLQGRRRTWFCGSYFGYGFHEDGIQSGLAVAEQLGEIKRPWQVENESGRIFLPGPALAEAAQ